MSAGLLKLDYLVSFTSYVCRMYLFSCAQIPECKILLEYTLAFGRYHSHTQTNKHLLLLSPSKRISLVSFTPPKSCRFQPTLLNFSKEDYRVGVRINGFSTNGV